MLLYDAVVLKLRHEEENDSAVFQFRGNYLKLVITGYVSAKFK